MFERAAVYGLITNIGNANIPEPYAPIYSKAAGGNGDSYAKYRARKARYEFEETRRHKWLGETRTLAQWIPDIVLKKNGYWSKSKRSAFSYMINHEDVTIAFLLGTYRTKQDCYWKTESAERLAVEFLEWFQDARKELRHKMGDTSVVEVVTNEIIKSARPKGTISHGGIANLLKVLTKTMEQQGADIRNIAKMQYGICRQAGILIPNEFIEDVAVVLNAQGEL